MKEKIRSRIMAVAIYLTLGAGIACMTVCNIMSALSGGVGQPMPESLMGEYGKGFGLMIVGMILLVSNYRKEE